MKRFLKYVAFVAALPVALVVVTVMAMLGCKKQAVVCDPVPPPATGATGPGSGPGTTTRRFVPTGDPVAPPPTTTTQGAGATGAAQTNPFTRPEYPPVCDPVHMPPPPPPPPPTAGN